MDTQAVEIETSEPQTMKIESYPFIKDVKAGSMSRAEMLEYWEKNGVFDPWPQHDEIGEGKKYADSTEYVQAMRSRADYRGRL